MATSLRCRVSAISAFCRPTTQTPSITNCLVAIVRTKPVNSNFSPNVNWLPWQRPSAPLDPHLTHDSYGPSKPQTQMASPSLQPFSHREPQSVPILYNGTPLSPSKLPLPMGDLDPHLIHGSLVPPESSTQTASQSVQPFLHGSLM